MTIRDAIRDAAQRQGWAQNELAAAAGMTPGKLSLYLRGKGDCNGETLDRLLAALGLAVCENP